VAVLMAAGALSCLLPVLWAVPAAAIADVVALQAVQALSGPVSLSLQVERTSGDPAFLQRHADGPRRYGCLPGFRRFGRRRSGAGLPFGRRMLCGGAASLLAGHG